MLFTIGGGAEAGAAGAAAAAGSAANLGAAIGTVLTNPLLWNLFISWLKLNLFYLFYLLISYFASWSSAITML